MSNKIISIKKMGKIKNARVLIRVDYNVPMDENGNITDDKRIKASLKTIKYCLDKGAKIILCSHFGRPKGQKDSKYSLEPVVNRLRELLPETVVYFAFEATGKTVEKQSKVLEPGEILLLENTRFYKGEEENDPKFAKELAKMGDVFVNDAFGTAHRAHASTVGVTEYLPAYAGFLIEEELKYLDIIKEKPKRPFTVIMGGKKVEDKLPIVEKLMDKANNLLIAGKLAAEWKLTQGETQTVIDVATDAEFDINKETIERWKPVIKKSKTIFWNGPVGKFEMPEWSHGTKAIAEAVSKSKAISIVGGGDTAAAVAEFKFTHISTGGGAALEYIQGKTLPGLEVLYKKKGRKK